MLLLAHAAISKIDLALEQGDVLALYEALATPALGLRGLLRENCDWYFKQFLSDRQQKQEVWKSQDYPNSQGFPPFTIPPLTVQFKVGLTITLREVYSKHMYHLVFRSAYERPV